MVRVRASQSGLMFERSLASNRPKPKPLMSSYSVLLRGRHRTAFPDAWRPKPLVNSQSWDDRCFDTGPGSSRHAARDDTHLSLEAGSLRRQSEGTRLALYNSYSYSSILRLCEGHAECVQQHDLQWRTFYCPDLLVHFAHPPLAQVLNPPIA